MESLYKSLFSSSQILLEQLSREICSDRNGFGPSWILLDEQRDFAAGDKESFQAILSQAGLLDKLCSRVNDGIEPALVQMKDCCVAAGQIYTEQSHCGYMLLRLPGYCEDTAQANLDLVEMLMSQTNALMQLIEKNNQLHQTYLSRQGEKIFSR